MPTPVRPEGNISYDVRRFWRPCYNRAQQATTEPNQIAILSPQKFILKGQREISMVRGQSVEFHAAAVEAAIKEMIDNLEGYLYVTSPVLVWEGNDGGPVIHQGHNFNNDTVFLKIEGSGYLDAESSGEDEIIEV